VRITAYHDKCCAIAFHYEGNPDADTPLKPGLITFPDGTRGRHDKPLTCFSCLETIDPSEDVTMLFDGTLPPVSLANKETEHAINEMREAINTIRTIVAHAMNPDAEMTEEECEDVAKFTQLPAGEIFENEEDTTQ
jgi:hypothetical protein